MAAKTKTPPTRLLLLASAAVLAVALVLAMRARSASASDLTSGNPGPDLTGSAAQQPSGGAASVPGNLPDSLLTSPDPVQQQVQQTDAGSAQAPASLSSASGVTASIGPYGFTTYTDNATGATYTTDVGVQARPPSYNPQTGSWFEGSLPTYGSASAALPLPTSSPKQSLIALHAAAGRDTI